MYRKTKVNVNSLSRKESKKLKKIRETKVRQETDLTLREYQTKESVMRKRLRLRDEFFRELPHVEKN